ncbi:hypothetical protein [Bifidobacterium tissieri]|uniref:Uncharacterized protein n=1 Tax=Bifidobacterium tissieri TaxID=1630162 RepID=A0A5M9ZVT2_9BIFI|nr:hypothetical protein [Bifidobacterium tissieri]KAA8828682.1 hypothetical protein EM849_11635 [Bifidobacterium tissieri]KAA8831625.1 hypothetical protein EMO89_02550 [Bifidobacterium tissieri]
MPKSQLWWVTQDMTALAVNTAEDTEGFREDVGVTIPADTGFIVWDGGLPIMVETPPASAVPKVRVDALFWDWIGGRLHYQLFTADRGLVASQRVFYANLPLAMARTPRVDIREEMFIMRVLAATWALSAQPTVSMSRDGAWNERVDGIKPRALKRQSTVSSEVKLVYLRENRTSPREGDVESVEPSREYSCRWIVRGFYRNQPYGPNRSLRRKQWIPPYVKGPADKPLKLKPTVHVWRR